MNKLMKMLKTPAFLMAFLATIIIHGEIFFNKISWHDDANFGFSGWTGGLRNGRWFHAVLVRLTRMVSGIESTPVFWGIIVAICIGIITYVLFRLFKINDFWSQFVLILIFVSIPAVTGNLGYMYNAGYDFVGRVFCVISAYFVCKNLEEKNIKTYLLSLGLCACAIGVYQCYLTFFLCIMLFCYIQYLFNHQITWKEFWTRGIYYIITAILSLLLYLIALKVLLWGLNAELNSYAGADTYGMVNLNGYLDRIVLSYKEFFVPDYNATYNMFPFHWKGWYKLFLAVLGMASVGVLSIKLKTKQYQSALQCLIAIVLIPPAINFNFILYGKESVHSLHVYHYILVFVYLFVAADTIIRYIKDNSVKVGVNEKLEKGIKSISFILTMVLAVLYIRYDNYCYMQMEVKQEASISYFTTLVTRIQMIEDYSETYPVVFINEFEKENQIDTVPHKYDYPITNPYYASIVNSYNWEDFMAMWCGYMPTIIDEEEYQKNDIVESMPNYPEAGSIRVVDDVIVVKF